MRDMRNGTPVPVVPSGNTTLRLEGSGGRDGAGETPRRSWKDYFLLKNPFPKLPRKHPVFWFACGLIVYFVLTMNLGWAVLTAGATLVVEKTGLFK